MNNQQEKCMKCGTPIDYEPEYCCKYVSIESPCGCMGKPIEPPLCEKCWDEVMK